MHNKQLQDYKKQIMALPQAPHLKEGDVDAWLAGMMERYERTKGTPLEVNIQWHIDRLRGIGGSESGRGLMNKMGEYTFGETLPDLYDEKMLRVLPQETEFHMRRGKILEPVVEQLFLNTYKEQNARTDTASMEAIANFKGSKTAPWLVGNPDHICLFDTPAGTRRYIVDFKMPNNPMSVVPTSYKAQLHHYWLLAYLNKIKVDGLLIASASFEGANDWARAIHKNPQCMAAAETLALTLADDPDNPPMRVYEVDFSLDFTKQLIQSNTQLWSEHVLQGKRPAYIKKDAVELTEEELNLGAELAARVVRRKALIEHAEELNKVDNAQLTKILDNKQLTGKQQPFPLVNVSKRSYLDTRRSVGVLQSEGIDTNTLRSDKKIDIASLTEAAKEAGIDVAAHMKYDDKKIKEALTAKGYELDEFQSEKLIVGISRKRKGIEFSTIQAIKLAAHDEVTSFANLEISVPEEPGEKQTTKQSTEPTLG